MESSYFDSILEHVQDQATLAGFTEAGTADKNNRFADINEGAKMEFKKSIVMQYDKTNHFFRFYGLYIVDSIVMQDQQ